MLKKLTKIFFQNSYFKLRNLKNFQIQTCGQSTISINYVTAFLMLFTQPGNFFSYATHCRRHTASQIRYFLAQKFCFYVNELPEVAQHMCKLCCL